nr:hypothetical protein CFP56_44430 [Quercus suber]
MTLAPLSPIVGFELCPKGVCFMSGVYARDVVRRHGSDHGSFQPDRMAVEQCYLKGRGVHAGVLYSTGLCATLRGDMNESCIESASMRPVTEAPSVQYLIRQTDLAMMARRSGLEHYGKNVVRWIYKLLTRDDLLAVPHSPRSAIPSSASSAMGRDPTSVKAMARRQLLSRLS